MALHRKFASSPLSLGLGIEPAPHGNRPACLSLSLLDALIENRHVEIVIAFAFGALADEAFAKWRGTAAGRVRKYNVRAWPPPVAIPEEDLPPGSPAWMRSVEVWADRQGRSAEERRATIAVTVPPAARPWRTATRQR